ncbi:6089_t:CDS:2, partial [Gigaspora margarita]
ETVNKIDAKKDIPKELIKLLKAELYRVNIIELDSTITKANDIGKIDIGKDDTQLTKDIKNNIPIEEGYQKFIEIENKIVINKAEKLYYQDKISLRKVYKDWKKRINKRQIDDDINKVKKNKHEVFKNHEKLTKLNEETQVKNRLKILSYCQKPAKIEHINEIKEHYSKINTNKGPDIINDLECTCEIWKKKVETLKGVTKKFKEDDPNELKKQEEYKPNNLNYSCATWIKRVDKFKIMIKYLYEPDNPKRCKAANKVNLPNIEILRKDKAQST